MPTAKATIAEGIVISMIKVVGKGLENKKEIFKTYKMDIICICSQLKLIHDHFTVVFTFSARLFFSIEGFDLLFWFFLSFFNELLGLVFSLGSFCELCGDNISLNNAIKYIAMLYTT